MTRWTMRAEAAKRAAGVAFRVIAAAIVLLGVIRGALGESLFERSVSGTDDVFRILFLISFCCLAWQYRDFFLSQMGIFGGPLISRRLIQWGRHLSHSVEIQHATENQDFIIIIKQRDPDLPAPATRDFQFERMKDWPEGTFIVRMFLKLREDHLQEWERFSNDQKSAFIANLIGHTAPLGFGVAFDSSTGLVELRSGMIIGKNYSEASLARTIWIADCARMVALGFIRAGLAKRTMSVRNGDEVSTHG